MLSSVHPPWLFCPEFLLALLPLGWLTEFQQLQDHLLSGTPLLWFHACHSCCCNWRCHLIKVTDLRGRQKGRRERKRQGVWEIKNSNALGEKEKIVQHSPKLPSSVLAALHWLWLTLALAVLAVVTVASCPRVLGFSITISFLPISGIIVLTVGCGGSHEVSLNMSIFRSKLVVGSLSLPSHGWHGVCWKRGT